MSGTLHYPDISSWDAGVNFRDSYVVCVKATQGTNYKDPYYDGWKQAAHNQNVYFMGYHFLMQGNGAAQANYAYSVIGPNVPLMLDIESTMGSYPSVPDVIDFIDRYRSLGGVNSYLAYLPHWYWQQQYNSQPLDAMHRRSMWLVSSDYTVYDDNGAGWNGYGGLGVAAWQYSSTIDYGGVGNVDFNAFKGTGSSSTRQTLSELDRLVKTGQM